MSHLSATKLTFSAKWDDHGRRGAGSPGQVATSGIVSKCGGEIKAQYVLWSDNCLFNDHRLPGRGLGDGSPSRRSLGRGAFVLQSQRAVPSIEDVLSWQDEVKIIAGR